MEKLQSSFRNMVLSLTLIALVAAGALGGVFLLTKEPIAQQQQAKQNSAIGSVLPDVEGRTIREPEIVNGYTVHEAFVADSLIGVAVETESNGFGGTIRLMVGFDAEGNIVNYEVLEQQETPGLGTHIVEWFKTDKNHQSVLGLNPAATNLTVNKDGGAVDAITAATISSRAFLLAIQNAFNAYFAKADEPVEANSGASCLNDSIAALNNDTTNLVNIEYNE